MSEIILLPAILSDTQQGILCNSQCPDELQLGELTSNNWHIGIKIFIAVLITGLAVLCVIIKVLFFFWLRWLEKQQDIHLNSPSYKKLESTDHDTPQVKVLPTLLNTLPLTSCSRSKLCQKLYSYLPSFQTVAYIGMHVCV